MTLGRVREARNSRLLTTSAALQAAAALRAASDTPAAPPQPFVLQPPPREESRPANVMKIHVLALPHTVTNKKFTTCAFTQKVVKLCAMLHRRGHHVIHYGVEGSEVECTEHVSIASYAEWSQYYTHPGANFYEFMPTEKHKPYIDLYTQRVAAALKARAGTIAEGKNGTEIVAMAWGGPQRDAVRLALGQPDGTLSQYEVETGIGYAMPWSPWRVYESYAWMHLHLGMEKKLDGSMWYHCVIPNSFDLNDFTPKDKPGDDFLFMGRLNADKGINEAIQFAKDAGRKITIVGQGDPTPYMTGQTHVTYLPPASTEERRELLANAYAVLCPSWFIEPFCGVHMEAMLSGTPVITTDWGVFTETVLHGVTGYRCRTMEQFTWAAKNVDKLDRRATANWARANYSLERVALMYEEYFQSILNLKNKAGLYTPNPNRQQLDWLSRAVPATMLRRKDPFDALEWGIPPTPLDVPHISPPAPPKELSGWEADQQWERDWWGLDWTPKWDDEIRKQGTYFRLMGFPDNGDFGDKTVLDVGCGPVSTLTRTKHGFSRGVDPLAVSEATLKRYADAGIEFLNIKAEEMPVDRQFDEVWMYNTLQHVQDPHEILRRMIASTKSGTTMRIFEWIDLGICPGHPQNLTENMFDQHFPIAEWDRQTWNVGFLRGFGGTATEKYLAIIAVRR
jgi:glycosyltransferase involved in cell wall biosynthesis/SAM-dependent methyltransferase